MSTDNTQIELSGEDTQPSELDVLKQRATMMGITFSNNIGVEKLRERIEAAMAGEDKEEDKEVVEVNALTGSVPVSGPAKTLRQHLVEEQMKLVRLRITCMDPKKANLPGEIFTVANEYLGTVRKFVPFGEATDDGYHVPYCIYNMLKNRKYLQITTTKNKNTGQITVKDQWVREFALEVLEPLTKAELAQLATTQAAAGRID